MKTMMSDIPVSDEKIKEICFDETGCKLKGLCKEDCKTCTPERKQEKFFELKDYLVRVANSLVEIFVERIAPMVNQLAYSCKRLSEDIINQYPHKKVLHLARKHKKKRVRKKNMNRVKKWIKKNVTEGNREA